MDCNVVAGSFLQSCREAWNKGVVPTPARRAQKAEVKFRQRTSLCEADAFHEVTLLGSSRGLGWDGLKLDVSMCDGWIADDLMVDGHYLAFNLAETPINFEFLQGSEWITAILPPLAFWVNPEGRPFSLRHKDSAFFASCMIDGLFLDEMVGGHCALPPSSVIMDPVVAGIIRALITALFDVQNEHSRRLAQDLRRNFAFAIGTRHGTAVTKPVARGGIAPGQLRTLADWTRKRLNGPLTVVEMARRVGLSAAHFSREFKHSTGMTPWRFVIDLRLEAAREAIQNGASIGNAALQTGFSDQAHLTRVFKQHFGMPPSDFLRRQNRYRYPDSIENGSKLQTIT